MTRLDDFIQKNRAVLADNLCVSWCDDCELSAAITNGDVELPSWVSIAEDVDCIKLWDNEEISNGQYNSQNWGFITISYK